MCKYYESAHPTHVCIEFNASTDYITEKKRRTETKWFKWLFSIHNLPTRNHCNSIIENYGLLWLNLKFYICYNHQQNPDETHRQYYKIVHTSSCNRLVLLDICGYITFWLLLVYQNVWININIGPTLIIRLPMRLSLNSSSSCTTHYGTKSTIMMQMRILTPPRINLAAGSYYSSS